MSIQTLIKILTDSGIEKNEAVREVEMLIEHLCHITKTDLVKGVVLTDAQFELIKEKVEIRAEKRLPIQYIIGEAWFMGELFKVNSDVLIPRDETELLVTRAIDVIKNQNLSSVLDIGTGSGCIACTIAKQTEATVLGVDISSDALIIALDNVTKLGINNRAVFRKSNLFEKVRSEEKFDLIISNPPYIPRGTELQEEVKFEPEIALFADEDGLAVYRKIIEEAPDFLNKGGYLFFELGINESEKVKSMMSEFFSEIVVEKDFAGIDRVIYGKCIK